MPSSSRPTGCAAWMLALTLAAGSSVADFGPETFDADGVGSTPAGWTTHGAGTVSVQPASPPAGNQALRLESVLNEHSSNARRAFPQLSRGDIFLFTADWRAESGNHAGLVFRLSTSNVNDDYVTVSTTSGRSTFQLTNEGSDPVLTDDLVQSNTYTPGRWYRFELIGLIGSDTYDLRIIDRGEDNASDISIHFDTADLPSPPAVDRANEAVEMFSASTWPGQSPDGHHVDIDNVSLEILDELPEPPPPPPPPTWTLTVDPFTRRMVGGVSEIERQVFFNIHNRWGTGTNAMEAEIRNDLNAYWGRDMWHVQGLSGLTEDPNRDGYADPAYFNQPVGPWSQNRTQRIEAPHVDMLLCTKNYHEFMEVKGREYTGTPNDPDAAAELFVRIFNNWMQHAGAAPTLFEVHNESNIPKEWTWHYDDDAWDKLILHHNTMAHAVKAAQPQIRVGGPTTAWPEYARNDFGSWRDKMEKFIPQTGPHLDFYSIHTYDNAKNDVGPTDVTFLRTGERLDAVIDLIEARTYETLGEIKPLVASEFGTLVKDVNGAVELKRWLIARAASGQMVQYLSKPDRMLKVVPFILVNVDYVSPENRMYMREDSVWRPTGHVDLYRLWSGLGGDLVEMTVNMPDVRAIAMVNGDTLSIYVASIADAPVELELETDLQADDVQHAFLRRLGQTDGVIDYTVQPVGLADIGTLTLDPWESVVVEIGLASHHWTGQLDELTFDTGRTIDVIGSDPIIYTIDLPDHVADTASRASLRVGLGRDFDKARRASSISVNGVDLAQPPEPLTDRHVEHDEYFGTTTYDVPVEALGDSNTIELTFPDQGGRVSSVRLIVAQSFCERDLTRDGSVNVLDLVDYLRHYDAGDPAADESGDGSVNLTDLLGFVVLTLGGCP